MILPSRAALCLGVLATLLACGSDAGTAAPLVDLPALAGVSPAAVDAALGEPEVTMPIQGEPGELRDYPLPGDAVLTVRFHEDRAVFFTANLPTTHATAEEALRTVGIDVGGAAPDEEAAVAVWWWEETIGDKTFARVGALRGMQSETDQYDVVQAEFR